MILSIEIILLGIAVALLIPSTVLFVECVAASIPNFKILNKRIY